MRIVTKANFFLLCLFGILSLAACCCDANDDSEWRYVPDDAFGQVPWQSIRLSDQELDGMRIDVDFRGSQQRFAQLRYGSPNSTRVIVVVDHVRRGEFDFYVDRNRDRTIEKRELVSGDGRSRQCKLPLQMTRLSEVSYEPRSVQFRLALSGRTLSYSTIGFVEGRTSLSDRLLSVRRVDGDGNGFFADVHDRLWIDLDGDGEWDPFTEQFPFMPVMKVRQQRLAIRGDAIGKQLELTAITDVGRVQLRFESLVLGTEIAMLDVMLIGDDGSAFTIRSAKKPITVPVGRYAVATLHISLKDNSDDRVWRFVFSDLGSPRRKTWFDVAKDHNTVIDPVGALSFAIKIDGNERVATRGQSINVQPQLFTQGGLLINSGGCEQTTSTSIGSMARLSLRTLDSTVVATGQSGFL